MDDIQPIPRPGTVKTMVLVLTKSKMSVFRVISISPTQNKDFLLSLINYHQITLNN